jgi:hypothetical protein
MKEIPEEGCNGYVVLTVNQLGNRAVERGEVFLLYPPPSTRHMVRYF